MKYLIKINKKLIFYLLKSKLGSYKSFINIGNDVIFQNPHCLHFGVGVGIGNQSCFLPLTNYAGLTYNPKITIGDRCSIGIRNSFACIDRIKIGNDVLFAGFVHLTDHSHGYEKIDEPIVKQQLISKGPIIIEDQCWLGFGCEILSGVRIGRHSIVAARSVVTKDVPPYSVVAGNPARVVKQYSFEQSKWLKI